MSSQQSGPGFLGRVAELGAGIAVGHVAAHALEGMLFGGREATPAQLEQAERKILDGPCSVQYTSFDKCLQHNMDKDPSVCSWAYEMFAECQSNNNLNKEFEQQTF